jgi:hypothetical protein
MVRVVGRKLLERAKGQRSSVDSMGFELGWGIKRLGIFLHQFERFSRYVDTVASLSAARWI